MKITIDYTFDVRGEKLQPFNVSKDRDLLKTYYKYKNFYIQVSLFVDTREDTYSAVICRDKKSFDTHLIDGINVIITNYSLTYDELVKEIETAMGMIEGTIKYLTWIPNSSVNKAL